jgi:hypothetical protein
MPRRGGRRVRRVISVAADFSLLEEDPHTRPECGYREGDSERTMLVRRQERESWQGTDGTCSRYPTANVTEHLLEVTSMYKSNYWFLKRLTIGVEV